jgi:hypothetical protein
MSEHSKYSPSRSPIWLVCAGATALEAGKPDTSSEAADEGTAAHALVAKSLELNKPTKLFKGDRIPAGNRTFEVDAEMASYGQVYVDEVLRHAEGGQLIIERRVDYSSYVGIDDQTGTADAIIIHAERKRLEVHDFKYGRGVRVDAKDNSQLMLYALGALAEFELVYEFDEVLMAIHQPRLDHYSEEVVKVEALREFGKKAGHAIRRSEAAIDLQHQPHIPAEGGPQSWAGFYLNPGEKQCRFCKAKPTCPALADRVFDIVYEAMPDTGSVVKLTAKQTRNIKEADNAQLDEFATAVDIIKMWCTAVETEVARRLHDGESFENFKLVLGNKGHRKWEDAAQVEAMLKSFRLKDDQMYSKSIISPAAAETLAKDKVIGERQWPKLKALIRSGERVPVVVGALDPRAAYVAADEFEDLTANETGDDLV